MTSNNEPHIYQGTGQFCLRCFKTYSIGNHTSSAAVESKQPKISILDLIVKNDEPVFTESDFDHVDAFVRCIGHKCSKCSENIYHDYDCSDRPRTDLLCAKCTESIAISLNRDNDLEFLENLEAISPREAKELDLMYEARMDLNIYHNPDGSERTQDEWMPLWEKHYANLQSLIERYRIYSSVAFRTKAKKQQEEITKLSPEEREEFIKLAKKKKLDDNTKKQAKSSIGKKADETKKKYDANLAAIKQLMMSQGVSEEAINKLMEAQKKK